MSGEQAEERTAREGRPVRIQRKRSKGWKMPPNTVYVGRPTKWGNPWRVDQYWEAGFSGSEEVAARCCVEAFKFWMLERWHWAHSEAVHRPRPSVTELRGKNLACWCKPGMPCHADALLELANAAAENSRSKREAETA